MMEYLKFKISEALPMDHYKLKIWNDKENDWSEIELHTDEDWSEIELHTDEDWSMGKTAEWIYGNLELEEDVPGVVDLGIPSKLSLIE
jgi:hypothetical protein